MADLAANDEGVNLLKRTLEKEEPAPDLVSSTTERDIEANTGTKSEVASTDAIEPASKRVKVGLSEDQSQGETEPKDSANGSLKVESTSLSELKPRVKGMASIKSE